MGHMNKHQLLEIDTTSTVKFSTAELKKMNVWLNYASVTLEKLITEGLIKGKGPKKIRISLLLCGDARIKQINREFRDKDKVTDVLSFPSNDDLIKTWETQSFDGELFLGDLAICIPQLKRQARQFNIGFWDEFVHLFFHGVLHLWGYDHERSAKDEVIMQKWEDRAMEHLSALKKKAKTI